MNAQVWWMQEAPALACLKVPLTATLHVQVSPFLQATEFGPNLEQLQPAAVCIFLWHARRE